MGIGIDVRITGAEQLEKVARAVRAHGDKELRKDLLRGLRTATKPMIESIRDEARADLPHSGGLNEWVASSKIAARSRTSGKSAGVRITGSKAGHDIKGINAGQVRHPVYGNTSNWVSQSVTSGWWERGANKKADAVRRDLLAAMIDVVNKIARSA